MFVENMFPQFSPLYDTESIQEAIVWTRIFRIKGLSDSIKLMIFYH